MDRIAAQVGCYLLDLAPGTGLAKLIGLSPCGSKFVPKLIGFACYFLSLDKLFCIS